MSEKDRQKTLLHDRGICVVIPTYNNGGTIATVVKGALAECQDVIVVNDGSTDDTRSILTTLEVLRQAQEPFRQGQELPFTLVDYPQNRGKGYALKRGFERALELGFSYAITLDGDGQHYPEDIQKFLQGNLDHPGALIIGNRNLEGVERSKGSNFANQFSNFWFYIQTGRKLSDTQTGYRLYPLKKLHGLRLLTSRYEAELELLVFASWHGVEIVPIPIEVYYPPQDERVSHFRPGKDFARISILNTVLCLLAIVYGLPLRLARWLMKYIRTYYALLFFIIFSLFIITPLVWVYVNIGKMTEKKRYRLHQILYWSSRFVMIKHGIPGTSFTYQVADGVLRQAQEPSRQAQEPSRQAQALRQAQGPSFDKPYIIICNHQSHLDLVCQLIFSPKMIFLTNDWVWHNPFYGFLIRHAEYYPVAEGIDALLPKLKSLVERGYSIAVFPEGTRSKDCKIGRFHQGAFYLSQQLGIDILPMCLYGPGKVLPKKTYTLRKSPIYIQVDSPVTQAELQAMGDTKAQASQMRKRYQEEYSRITNRIEQDV
jgi:1-acyl-sn-glycerol-3-phosphate acyltransferase